LLAQKAGTGNDTTSNTLRYDITIERPAFVQMKHTPSQGYNPTTFSRFTGLFSVHQLIVQKSQQHPTPSAVYCICQVFETGGLQLSDIRNSVSAAGLAVPAKFLPSGQVGPRGAAASAFILFDRIGPKFKGNINDTIVVKP
jgi:hypothetical protein